MKWSVNIVAEGDRVMSREEIVELADAVAASGGIASGIGTTRYGAQLLVDAEDRDRATQLAVAEFNRAVAQAGLPPWPIATVGAISEADDAVPDWQAPPALPQWPAPPASPALPDWQAPPASSEVGDLG